MPARRLAITFVLCYDGSSYQGFQKQPHGHTIQDAVNQTLSKLFACSIASVAAGRTDSNVHADEQLLLVELPTARLRQIGAANLPRILNNKLPASIRILRQFSATGDFHPRYSAKVRVYQYRLYTGIAPNAAALSSSYHYPYPLECGRFLRLLKVFEGTHDFSTFATRTRQQRAAERPPNNVRTLYKVDQLILGQTLQLELYGNAFLYGMVRSLIGNALQLARMCAEPHDVRALLAACDPTRAKARVPGHALTLKRVFYTPLFPTAHTPPPSLWTGD